MLIEVFTPAPVLNTPDFNFAFGGANGKEIPLNKTGFPYHFEFVALKGMVFRVEERIPQPFGSIDRVTCREYPISPLYLDSRFTIPKNEQTFPRSPTRLLDKKRVLSKMKEKIGTPYVWGGNWSQGIPELLTYYPPKGNIDHATQILWTMQGVDCSGLLYEAAEGAAPRNTSELLYFGNPVPIGEPIHPLDMILYPGHVIFALDEVSTIESKYPFGVICRNLEERFKELNKERNRINRWTPESDRRTNYIVLRIL